MDRSADDGVWYDGTWWFELMNRIQLFFRYLYVEEKKSICVFKKALGSFAVMLFGVAAGIFLLSRVFLNAQLFEPVQVAMVIPKEETQTKLVTKVLSSMESVKSICTFSYYEEETEGLSRMKEGSVQILIVIPQNFYADVDQGKNTPPIIYVPENMTPRIRMFTELVKDGVFLLQTAESGVYATLDTADIYRAVMTPKEIGNFVAQLYVEQAFSRGELFSRQVISPFGELEATQYYLTAAVTVILLLSGLFFNYLYQKKARSVEEKLRMYGMGAVVQSVQKVLLMAQILWLFSSMLYILLCAVSEIGGGFFLNWEWKNLFALLPLSLAMAAVFHLLYELAGASRQGAVLLLAVLLFSFFCSGALIPAAFLPDWLGKIGSVLPLAVFSRYVNGVFYAGVQAQSVVGMLISAILLTMMGAWMAWKRT
ncbi:MAG: ABC transporter permease [Lachnospiraceae bacterium]